MATMRSTSLAFARLISSLRVSWKKLGGRDPRGVRVREVSSTERTRDRRERWCSCSCWLRSERKGLGCFIID